MYYKRTLTVSWSPFCKPLTWKSKFFHRQCESTIGLTHGELTYEIENINITMISNEIFQIHLNWYYTIYQIRTLILFTSMFFWSAFKTFASILLVCLISPFKLTVNWRVIDIDLRKKHIVILYIITFSYYKLYLIGIYLMLTYLWIFHID